MESLRDDRGIKTDGVRFFFVNNKFSVTFLSKTKAFGLQL